MSNKKVLIITYYWPPSGGPGVQRWLKFAKYLPDLGVNTHVLTVDPNKAEYPMRDESLISEVPLSVKVHTTPTWEPFQWYKKLTGKKKVSTGNTGNNKSLTGKLTQWIRANLFVPDARKYWHQYAVSKANELIQSEGISTIITTGPPHSTHLIGLTLKQQHQIKWIADFRDPWSNFMFNEQLPRTNWAEKKDKKLEHSVLQMADEVMVAHDKLHELFSKTRDRVHLIHNGYDEADFTNIEAAKKTERFELIYIGNFRATQNLQILWQALSELQSEGIINEHNFTFRLVGEVDKSILKAIKDFHLSALITQMGYLAHKEALYWMMQSNMLYISIPEVGTADTIIPGKTFEYLSAETPLLAVGPSSGSLDMVMERANRPRSINFDEKDVLKQRLLNAFNYWKENEGAIHKTNAPQFYENYSRRALTKKVLNLVN